MKANWKVILQDMVALIQDCQNETIIPETSKYFEISIKKQYSELYDKAEVSDFYEFLYDEFGNESELYPLLLSILYKSTFDGRCLQEVLKLLSEGRLNVFSSISLRQQVEFNIFTNSAVGPNYELRRKVHQIQLGQMEKLLDIQYPYVPWEERNENRIIVVTNQLLGSMHAPTRNVMEVCSALMDIGKDVILIVAVEIATSICQRWYNPINLDYMKINNDFTLDYFEHNIRGYQILLTEPDLNKVKSLTDAIYNLKPQMIWYMGGTSLFADLFRKSFTVLSMPFTDGYSISEASIMVEYMNSRSADIKGMEAYLAKENQVPIHFDFEQIIRPSIINHSRQEFQLPEEGFLITIVGNRLSYEIKGDFIEVLNKILAIHPNIYLVFIGELDQLKGIDENRAFFIGRQTDLIGVLSIMNLFVNPPRKGGGTGAYWSLFNSVPVVTLDFCDVANCVSDEFICYNEDEIVLMVEKHFKDKQYHEEMRKKSKKLIDEIEKKNDIKVNINKLFTNVKEVMRR